MVKATAKDSSGNESHGLGGVGANDRWEFIVDCG